MKQYLFDYLNQHLSPYRLLYNELMDAPDHIESVLRKGQLKARERSIPFLENLRKAVGISHIQ